ncbi:MAG: helix-turn-helix domain-containing protein, partial [Gemmatimonadaceae bacterium]|nr:helix-turn-helix domain-containing protein [Gemmatimonadaceae bacterium]
MRVNQVADNFGVSIRTCNRRLADSSIAPLVDIISYCRALRAALLLEDADRSVAFVAAELGFPGDQALRMHIKRRLGVTPTMCRGGQVREHVLDA